MPAMGNADVIDKLIGLTLVLGLAAVVVAHRQKTANTQLRETLELLLDRRPIGTFGIETIDAQRLGYGKPCRGPRAQLVECAVIDREKGFVNDRGRERMHVLRSEVLGAEVVSDRKIRVQRYRWEMTKISHVIREEVTVISHGLIDADEALVRINRTDRKSTRLNSSHPSISYAV